MEARRPADRLPATGLKGPVPPWWRRSPARPAARARLTAGARGPVLAGQGSGAAARRGNGAALRTKSHFRGVDELREEPYLLATSKGERTLAAVDSTSEAPSPGNSPLGTGVRSGSASGRPHPTPQKEPDAGPRAIFLFRPGFARPRAPLRRCAAVPQAGRLSWCSRPDRPVARRRPRARQVRPGCGKSRRARTRRPRRHLDTVRAPPGKTGTPTPSGLLPPSEAARKHRFPEPLDTKPPLGYLRWPGRCRGALSKPREFPEGRAFLERSSRGDPKKS